MFSNGYHHAMSSRSLLGYEPEKRCWFQLACQSEWHVRLTELLQVAMGALHSVLLIFQTKRGGGYGEQEDKGVTVGEGVRVIVFQCHNVSRVKEFR